ncbi:MAG: T9SS type A sorting domain-containing protein [Bacteroidota bacterium]
MLFLIFGNSGGIPLSRWNLGLMRVGGTSDMEFVDIDGDGDLDAFIGQYEYSEVRMVWMRETTNRNLRIYPNPGTGPLILTGLDLQEIESVRFYNAMGHLLKRVQSDYGAMDVSLLPAGWYNVEVVLANGQLAQWSFVKQ